MFICGCGGFGLVVSVSCDGLVVVVAYCDFAGVFAFAIWLFYC